MNEHSDIRTRTFGIEIEMCNVERAKVSLPDGYSWSKEEQIDNTDCSCNRYFGGEVNTPPLHLCSQKELHELRSVYESMVAAGGRLKWSIDTHVHIYAGDLSVEQLKKVYLFFYVCYPYFKKYAKISDWDEHIFNAKPIPKEKHYEGVKNATSFEDLNSLFSNQSKKGYIRHAVNISAYFKTKTIEFRTFHATDDFYKAMSCVYSTYRIFYYAISHELEDFQSITSYEQFCAVTGLKYNVPEELCPLIYQGNPYSAIEAFMTKPLSYNSQMASALYDAVKANGHKEICIVNGFMYFYELAFLDKMDVSIYCQDAYLYLLYLLANGKTTISYKDKLSWLEDYNTESPSRQVAIALFLSRVQKYSKTTNERNTVLLEAIKCKTKESIEKTEKSCAKLLKLLTTCKFHIGTLNEAITKENVIFFNYGRVEKKQARTFRLIAQNSDLSIDFHIDRNDYYNLIESLPTDSYFYYFSNSPYLRNLHKIAMWDSPNAEGRTSAGRYLYCNKHLQKSKVNSFYDTASSLLDINEPPDSLVIDNPKKLHIINVNNRYLYSLQKKYIMKVDNITEAKFCFVVKYEDYVLGGFGFDFPRKKGYSLWQLSDFCTNNNIEKLSKLILLCVQSAGVQRVMNRILKVSCETVHTYVYTHKPVSMKYRGLYKKVKELSLPSRLFYEGVLGVYKTEEDIINKYKSILKNGKQG